MKQDEMTYSPAPSLSGRFSVYTTKDMWSHAFQTTSASGLSDGITIRGRLHFDLNAVHLGSDRQRRILKPNTPKSLILRNKKLIGFIRTVKAPPPSSF